MRSLPAVLAIVAACSLTAAEPTERQLRKAWEWKLEERMAMRLDPAARAARVTAHVRDHGGNPGAINDSISGERPELFLPHELFDSLISEAERRIGGKPLMVPAEVLRQHGFDEATFWTELARIAAPMIEARRQKRELHTRFAKASMSEQYAAYPEFEARFKDVCRTSFDALNDARAHFGAVKLDRFLYSALAPNMALGFFANGPSIVDHDTLTGMLAEGCR